MSRHTTTSSFFRQIIAILGLTSWIVTLVAFEYYVTTAVEIPEPVFMELYPNGNIDQRLHRHHANTESPVNHNGAQNISDSVKISHQHISDKNFKVAEPRCSGDDPDDWQVVVANISYVYAAHLNPEQKGSRSIIEIIGTLRDKELVQYQESDYNKERFYCRIYSWSRDSHTYDEFTVTADITRLQDRLKVFSSVQYTCLTNMTSEELNDVSVSLLHHSQLHQDPPPTCMKLRQNFKQPLKYNFTVCLGGPLGGDISPEWFVEWMELNIMFGAQKILIHGHVDELAQYLDYYKRTGVLELLPWAFIPEIMEDRINMPHQQQSLLTDCLYRMRRHTKYIVQNDLDEVITPRHPDDKTWEDMIQRNQCGNNVRIFGFRQFLYCLRCMEDNFTSDFLTQDAIYRYSEILQYPGRAKYIADTFHVTSLENHSANGVKPICTLDVNIGGSHHYRAKEPKMHVKTEIITDRTMNKFRRTLTRNVKITKSSLFQ